jgi:DNA-binding MarR family transcriptional regulator
MPKPSSPKHLADLLDRLAPALRRMQGSGGAHAPRVRLLSHLLEAGPVPMREIARHLDISPQAVTGIVDALEADGLIGRERHSTDRRLTMVRLVPHAREAAKAARAERQDRLAALFRDVPKEDRAAFSRVVEDLLDRLSRDGAADGARMGEPGAGD